MKDSQRDSLTIIALGDVSIRGNIEAELLLSGIEGKSDPQRIFGSDTEIYGSMVLASGTYQSGGDIRIGCSERVKSLAENPDDLNLIHVGISPDALEGGRTR